MLIEIKSFPMRKITINRPLPPKKKATGNLITNQEMRFKQQCPLLPHHVTGA